MKAFLREAVPLDVEYRPEVRNKDEERNRVTPFIAWDGEETRDEGYCLFGSSEGTRIKHPHLSSLEMLTLIIETGKRNPTAFHVIFSGYYDVNWWIKDIGKRRVAILHHCGKVTWQGFKIEYIPHKIFTVSKIDEETGKLVRVRIDDCWTFYRSRFDKALVKYEIGTREEQEEVTRGKEHRKDFYWHEIDEIEKYWEIELRLLVELMARLRKDINSAGIYIGQWHGPGALASHALRKHKMGRHMKQTPEEIIDAVLAAYSAGWFERFKAGFHGSSIWTADINSAYVYAISLLPDMATGNWEHVDSPDPKSVYDTRFAVYHIRLGGGFSEYLASCHGIPMPLPLREQSGTISHPVTVDGWYWSPEAALVARNPQAVFVEAWIYHDDGTYPFAWVAEDYEQRLIMQHRGNPAEKILKWMLASLYGRIAQRVGWDEKDKTPPKWHQLEWAGFITSMCRSMIFKAAMDVAKRGGLVSIDTDGVMSTVPFDVDVLENGVGERLGEWKIEEFSGLIYIQNGIYWLRDSEGVWIEPKLRGIPREQVKDEQDGLQALAGRTDCEICKPGNVCDKIHLVKNSFIGYGQALHSDWDTWRTWQERPHDIEVNYSGKRQHSKTLCRSCRAGLSLDTTLHDLSPLISDSVITKRHSLPWREEKRIQVWEIIRHYQDEEDM